MRQVVLRVQAGDVRLQVRRFYEDSPGLVSLSVSFVSIVLDATYQSSFDVRGWSSTAASLEWAGVARRW
jgi:hypothetical protein